MAVRHLRRLPLPRRHEVRAERVARSPRAVARAVGVDLDGLAVEHERAGEAAELVEVPAVGTRRLRVQRIHDRGEREVERHVVVVGIAVAEVVDALRLARRVAEAVGEVEVAELRRARGGARAACSSGSRTACRPGRPTGRRPPSTCPGWCGRTGTSTPRACAPAPRTRTTRSRSRTGRRSWAGGTRRRDGSRHLSEATCVEVARICPQLRRRNGWSAGAAEEAAGAGAGVDAVAAGDLAADDGGDVAVGAPAAAARRRRAGRAPSAACAASARRSR